MNTIGSRLKYLRKELLKLNQTNFANKLNLTQNFLTRLETGDRNFTERTLNDICRVYNVNINWLKYGKGDVFNPTTSDNINALVQEYNLDDLSKSIITTYVNLDLDTRLAILKFAKELSIEVNKSNLKDLIFIDTDINKHHNIPTNPTKIINLPTYLDFPASAGFGNPFNDDSLSETKEYILNDKTKDASFVVKVSGNSMEPTIKNHEEIFIKAMPQIEHGEIGLFSYNGDALCKRLVKENGVVILRSDNNAYPDIRLNENDYVVTFGKVIL